MATEFRLTGFLRLRRLQEEQAAAELARVNAELRAAESRRNKVAACLGAAALPMSGGVSAFQIAVAGRASLRGMLAESTAFLDTVNVRANDAKNDWTTRRTAVRTLDKLEGRHNEAVRAADARVEQLLLDEAALRGIQGTREER